MATSNSSRSFCHALASNKSLSRQRIEPSFRKFRTYVPRITQLCLAAEDVEEENMNKLLLQLEDKKNQHALLFKTSIPEMWTNELDAFINKYKIYKKERKMRQEGIKIKKKKTKKIKVVKTN